MTTTTTTKQANKMKNFAATNKETDFDCDNITQSTSQLYTSDKKQTVFFIYSMVVKEKKILYDKSISMCFERFAV